MNRFTQLMAIVCACSFVGLCVAEEKPALDQNFLIQASSCGHAAQKFSEVAAKQASDQAVKDFANKMVKEHTQCNERLAKMAKDKSLAIAVGAEKDTRDTLTRLGNLKGADFDREYLRVMIEGHEKGIRMLEAQTKSGKDENLNKFAEQTLPQIRAHLKEARDRKSVV